LGAQLPKSFGKLTGTEGNQMRRVESARKSGFLGGVPGAVVMFHARRDSKLLGKSLSSVAGIAMPPVKKPEERVETPADGSALFNSECLCWQGECGALCEGWCSVQQVDACDG
jgi:hypothetical protein